MINQVLVYGTLRPGQVNHDLVQADVVERVPAQLVGHTLKAAAHARFPYGTVAVGARIVGDLLRLRPGSEDRVVARLDALEGYRPDRPETSHYLRVDLVVTTLTQSGYGAAGTAVRAWVYLAGPGIELTDLTDVRGGDWTTRRPAGRWS